MNGALARALLRLFAVQGSYNYERMLGVGVGVAEEPLLRDLGDAKYQPAVARGAHFFNAHPYLVGLAVGAAARAEHDGASPDQVERLRFVYLTDEEAATLRQLAAGGVEVTAQDVPTARAVPIGEFT